MTLSLPTKVFALAPPVKKEKEVEKKKKATVKKAQPQKNSGKSSGDSIDWESASFDGWKVIKVLIDRCTLPNIIDRIVLTDLKHRTKDSLGAFLKLIILSLLQIQSCIL